MRKIGMMVAVAALMGSGALGAAEADGARAVVERAIKAQGGAAKIKAAGTATWKEDGLYYGMGEGLPYQGSYAIEGPERFRMEVKDVFTMVLNGDKGWVTMMGETKAMTKDQLAQQKQERRAGWVARLVPLHDKAFTLESLGDTTIDKRPARGVKVTHKGYPDVKLYFDKKTGLLIGTAFRVKDAETKKEVNEELVFRDYHGVDGLQVPKKIIMKRDGKLFVEATIKDWKAREKLDPKLFAKP